MEWHRLSPADVLQKLDGAATGLAVAEARKRLALHGANEIRRQIRRNPLRILLGQFADFMIIVLLIAALLSAAIGKLGDALPILAIVLLNAVIGFVQEFRAERALLALRKMAESVANLLRGGTRVTVATREIVPGDIVLLEAGNIVPADIRLIEAVHLKTMEAALTGESLPVEKSTAPLADEQIPLGDRFNMAYMGTVVSYGRGAGIVVATGMDTELGRIARAMQQAKEAQTPLQRRLALFGRRLSLAIFLACLMIFIAGFLHGEPLFMMLLTVISLAVAAIPEALPAVVSITLAFGARRLVRLNALIRRLPAVETLGSVTYICSDKTGTLTLNRMTVETLWVGGATFAPDELPQRQPAAGLPQSAVEQLLTALAVSNDAAIDEHGMVVGDPTEVALCTTAQSAGYDRRELDRQFSRLAELPFDSSRKCMTTVHRWGDRVVSFTKGAVEVVMAASVASIGEHGIEVPLRGDGILRQVEALAAEGQRVLAIAMRTYDNLPETVADESLESGLTFIGLVGMIDPPRPEARQAVAQCRTAGITPVMITGDHPLTARAIARRLAIVDDDGSAILTGRELAALSPDELAVRVESVRVYARVMPEQKLSIVNALQQRGHFVAMTGDGVNDAPAIKKADIGVAMGITGTDVAKEAAAMVLLDDNFATIVRAVREGRQIFANIRKFIIYSITSNTGTLLAVAFGPLFGLPLLLLPIQILWLNLLCDSLPGLALASEPADDDIMQRPPIKPREGIFAAGRGYYVVGFGFLIGGSTLVVQTLALQAGSAWQTMAFTFLIVNRLAVALAVRSDRRSLFSLGLFSNRPLAGALAIVLLLQLLVVYSPACNAIFVTSPLSLRELTLTVVAAVGGVLLISELQKAVVRSIGRRS